MKECEKQSTDLLYSTTELVKLIQENPTLPLLVLAGDSANSGDYSSMSCSYCSARIGEFLDCYPEFNYERIYADRDDFEEDLSETLYDGNEKLSDEEFDKLIKKELAEYEPYWKKCIILYVDN